jgi:hypothetical protein
MIEYIFFYVSLEIDNTETNIIFKWNLHVFANQPITKNLKKHSRALDSLTWVIWETHFKLEEDILFLKWEQL